MYSAFYVNESSCLTCNNQILKTLGTLQGVFGAELDRIEGRIVVSHTDEVSREQIADLLEKLGFPEKTDLVENINSEWGCAL